MSQRAKMAWSPKKEFDVDRLEKFSKTTAAKEKDRTSVKFHDKTTNSQKFMTKLRTALPNSPDLITQLTSLTFETKVPTL